MRHEILYLLQHGKLELLLKIFQTQSLTVAKQVKLMSQTLRAIQY